ncbi:MAG: Zn-dependent alcohol dehydrogenase [Anaerolineae bacterium]|nr:Zn-dependent alcohol dehydrogenase [Anaerolineae bacterium]
MKIQAALLTTPNTPLTVEQLTLDDPAAGEVLVKIVASGVCHSDYHVMNGATKHPLPAVLGHEGAGIVEAVGAGVTRVKGGDHITLNWAPDCGHCFYCLRGKPNLCETFTEPIWAGVMLDGTTRLHKNGNPVYHWCGLATFGEYAVVPQESCIPIRRDVPLKVAALVGCAVATGVGAAFYTAQVRPGESVVVVGCGGVGLNVLQGAALCGAETIIAVDTAPAKMDIARQFGATHTILANESPLQAIRDLTGGRGADHAFEAVGVPALQEQSLDYIRPGGTLTLVGISPMGTGTNLPGAILTRQEKVVKGSYYGTVNASRDFPLMLDLYMAGKLKLDELITQEYRLEQINEAFASMLSGEVARGVVVL